MIGNVSCEVEIHDYNTESSRDQDIKNLLDFDTDDENILSSLNVLVSDGSSLDLTPHRFAYPDANSHSNYNLINDDTPISDISRSRNLDVPYAKKNRNIMDDGKIDDGRNYRELRKILSSENSDVNAIESCDDRSSYSVANSHVVYGILSEESEKTWDDLSRERLLSFDPSDNYEIANSHSNYQVLYNRDDFIDWRTTYEQIKSDREAKNFLSTSETRCEISHDFARSRMKYVGLEGPSGNESVTTSDSSKSTEETSTTCDIEDCLIQIEESLMNIEQNLLHVQELDIPEFKSLLYESPMIDRNAQDFPDILSTESNISLKKSNIPVEKCVTDRVDNEDGDVSDNVGFESVRPISDRFLIDRKTVDETNNEKRANCENETDILQFTDEFSVSENIEYSTSLPSSTRGSFVCPNVDKNVNFIPNSLSKIPQRSIVAETRENIPGDRSESVKNSRRRSLDDDIIDLINYNLNNFTNDKFVGRKKFQSRTNSLDDNSMNRCRVVTDGANETIATNFRSRSVKNFLGIRAKARSENAIGNLVNNAYAMVREKSSNRAEIKSREVRIAEVEAKAEEFRRMIENIVTNRIAIGKTGYEGGAGVCKSNCRTSKNPHARASPKSCSVGNKNHEKNHDANRDRDNNSPSTNKPYAYEKRKRKKLTNRSFSGENALVPSKIISLSLSLLLAALLQAVRCLADLVEDAFRSVSFEKNGLLE